MKGSVMKKPKIVRYSSKGLKKLRQLGKSATNWSRVIDMEDKNIDFSDSPEIPPDVFIRCLVQKGLRTTRSQKSQLTLRIDEDVLKWKGQLRFLRSSSSQKSQLTLRIDEDVLKWFKSQGHG